MANASWKTRLMKLLRIFVLFCFVWFFFFKITPFNLPYRKYNVPGHIMNQQIVQYNYIIRAKEHGKLLLYMTRYFRNGGLVKLLSKYSFTR